MIAKLRARSRIAAFVAVIGPVFSVGSASSGSQTAFLTDYSKLAKDSDGAMRFLSPALADYTGFILDPVQFRTRKGSSCLSPRDRSEFEFYMQADLEAVLRERGYTLTQSPGPGIARIRMAITNVQKSTWWLKNQGRGALAGTGVGGASMEGEVVDSVTGAQLAAVVQSGRGDEFDVDASSRLADARTVVRRWADAAGRRLDELRRVSKP